jgi:hypothetical protein
MEGDVRDLEVADAMRLKHLKPENARLLRSQG